MWCSNAIKIRSNLIHQRFARAVAKLCLWVMDGSVDDQTFQNLMKPYKHVGAPGSTIEIPSCFRNNMCSPLVIYIIFTSHELNLVTLIMLYLTMHLAKQHERTIAAADQFQHAMALLPATVDIIYSTLRTLNIPWKTLKYFRWMGDNLILILVQQALEGYPVQKRTGVPDDIHWCFRKL